MTEDYLDTLHEAKMGYRERMLSEMSETYGYSDLTECDNSNSTAMSCPTYELLSDHLEYLHMIVVDPTESKD